MARSVEIARAFITLETETKGLDQQLSQAERSLGRTAKFVTDHPVAAFTALGTAALAVGLKLANMAAEVDHAFELISASIPEATSRLVDLRREASTLSQGFGISQQTIADGMLALAKTGINSIDDLIIANRAAVAASRATGAEFNTTISLLDSTLDSFGLSAKDSEAILAKLFITSQGKTSFQELAPIFEAVGKAAVKGGVDWATLTEAAVTLTTQGLKTKQIITALSKGLDEEGAPAIHRLAAASHVASDGVTEMAAQTERMNASLPNLQAQLKEKLNAELLELGRTALPLVISGLQAVQAILSTLGGGNKKLLDEAALGTLTSTLGVLAKFPAGSNAAKQALEELSGALTRIASVDVAGATTQQLALLQKGLTAAEKSGALSSAELQKVSTTLQAVNAEIRNRGNKPVIPPVDPKVAAGLREVTAGLLATGDASAKATKEAEKHARDAAAARKALFELERLVTGDTISLAEAQARAVEEIEIQFEDKMLDLKGKDLDRAKALLVQAKSQLTAHWAAIYDAINATVIPKLSDTETKLVATHTTIDQAVAKSGAAYGKLALDVDLAIAKQLAHRQVIAQTAQDVAGAVDVFGALAEAIGQSDPQLQKMTRGIADVADAIGQIAHGNIAGGLIQGISGLSGVISGLFGSESESARKLRVGLELTRDEIERHRQTLGDLIELSQPGAKVANLQGGIVEALAKFKDIQSKGGIAKVLTGIPDEILRPVLAKRGLSLEDLEKLAKDIGIDLRLGGPFVLIAQLENLLKEIDTRDSGFAQTFEGQLDRLTKRWEIIGANAETKLNDLVALATDPTLGSPALAGLKDFNLGSTAGRTGALDFLAKLLDRGELTNKDLGGLNLSKFREVLGQLAQLLKEQNATAAAEEATRQAAIKAQQDVIAAAQKAIDAAKAEAERIIAESGLTPEQLAQKKNEANTPQAKVAAQVALIEQALAAIAAAQKQIDALNGVSSGVPGGASGLRSGTPVPVDPIADPVFTPNLQASNWEELLGLQVEERDLLKGILAGLGSFAPIEAPPLPPGVLGNVLGSGGTSIIMNVGPITVIAQAGDDEEALALRLVEFMKSDRGKRVMSSALGTYLEDVEMDSGNASVRR